MMKKTIAFITGLILILQAVIFTAPTAAAADFEVKSISIEDQIFYEYVDGMYGIDENGYFTGFIYNLEPDCIDVEFTDGTKVSCTKGELYLLYGLELELEGDTSQSSSQWKAGSTHTVTATLDGKTCTFKVSIKKVLTKLELIKNPDRLSFSSGEFPTSDGARIKITHENGETFELDIPLHLDFYGYYFFFDPVIEKFVMMYNNVDIDNSGNYRADIYLGGMSVFYKAKCDLTPLRSVNIYEPPMKGLVLEIYDGYGNRNEAGIKDFVTLAENPYKENNGIISVESYVLISTESEKWYFAELDYDYDTSGESEFELINPKITIFNKEFTPVKGSIWLDSAFKNESVVKTVGLLNFTSNIMPVDFFDKANESNLDTLACISVACLNQYNSSVDIEYVYIDYLGTYALLSPEELEYIIRDTFLISNDSPLDFSSSEYIKYIDENTLAVPVFKDGFAAPSFKNENLFNDGSGYIFFENVTSPFDAEVSITVRIIYDSKTGKIKSLRIDRNPVYIVLSPNDSFKDTYLTGEELSLDGFELSLVYDDGYIKYIPVTSDMVTGFDSTTPGTKTLTITYNDPKTYKKFTTTVEVTVEKPHVPGDVNGDDVLTLKDVLILRKLAAGVLQTTDELIKWGDIDGDEMITLKDVLIAGKTVAGVK